MPELTATATCTVYQAVFESTGEVVAGRLLVRRVGWLLDLIGGLAAGVVASRWTPAALDELAGGVGPDGRVLPAKGWMAIRRLGWGSLAPGGVQVLERVRRAADEEAARALRLAVFRRSVLAAIIATWPEDPGKRTRQEWKDLRAALPDGVTSAEIRNRTRQVRDHVREHGVLPGDLTEMEDPARVAAQALLAAADKQLVILDRGSDTTAVLRVQLPATAAPVSYRDWAWHLIPLALPPNVPADARLCAPAVRVAKHRVRVDLPFKTVIPFAPAAGHQVGLGLDWGVNTLLTGSVGRLTSGKVNSDGRMLRYDATPVSAKLHRLRRHREALAAKRSRYEQLLARLLPGDARHGELTGLYTRVDAEHQRVCARIRHLNHALAWSAGRWAVDQASALGATVIYLEDLTTLEARGTRKGNARLSGQVRGTVVAAITHLAAKTGIAVVTVPARGTSRYCPRCQHGTRPLKHTPAPDRPHQSGWKWAICPECGLSCDRDWAAAERIVSRGLLTQAHTITERKTGTRTIRTTIEGNLRRARRNKNQSGKARRSRATGRDTLIRPGRTPVTKNRPTPKRPARTNKISRQMPDRRLVPSPTPDTGRGQRPEGQAPQTNQPNQPVRTGLARDSQHRTGFHRVHATPVIPLTADFGPRQRGPDTPVRIV
jgi:hypothetical protein